MSDLLALWQDAYSADFEKKLEKLFANEGLPGQERLKESMQYALFSGGKRFRPMLSLAASQSLQKDFTDCLDWAVAVELIHTYSLVHDDLPCMDDDDMRRGQPSVHKKFDETFAVLAGDTLLTYAFTHLAKNPKYKHCLADLIKILGEKSGLQGMVGGQANDCFLAIDNVSDLLFVHEQKTAALIQAAVLGPFYIFDKSPDLAQKIDEFSLLLGVLFQVKDDILDQGEDDGLPQITGLKNTEIIYHEYKTKALDLLQELNFSIKTQSFVELIDFNENRQK